MAAPIDKKPVYVGVVLDFETGGNKDATKEAITQLSAKMIRFDTFETLGTFNEYVYPYHKKAVKKASKTLKTKREMKSDDTEESNELMEYNEKALSVTGISLEMLYEKGIALEEMTEKFVNFIKENTLSSEKEAIPILVGQNITFDINYLLQMVDRTESGKEIEKVLAGDNILCGDKKIWVPKYIDTLPLSRAIYANRSDIRAHDLSSLGDLVGYENDDAHNAMFDVDTTSAVFQTYIHNARSEGGEELVLEKQEKERVHFKI